MTHLDILLKVKMNDGQYMMTWMTDNLHRHSEVILYSSQKDPSHFDYFDII